VTSSTTRPDSANIRFPPPVIYAAAILGGYVLELRSPWPILHSSGNSSGAVREGIALVVAAAGLALMFAAVLRFRRHHTPVVPIFPATVLATDGPYRISRNPMYVGLMLFSLAVAFGMNSGWTLLLLVPALAVMNFFVIAREERYLERAFGDEYRDYRRRTRRWI
jgi:protein-S-isoprenylcysteine O-methyltransferase Ste14